MRILLFILFFRSLSENWEHVKKLPLFASTMGEFSQELTAVFILKWCRNKLWEVFSCLYLVILIFITSSPSVNGKNFLKFSFLSRILQGTLLMRIFDLWMRCLLAVLLALMQPSLSPLSWSSTHNLPCLDDLRWAVVQQELLQCLVKGCVLMYALPEQQLHPKAAPFHRMMWALNPLQEIKLCVGPHQ